ncbi:hypothetical protein [Asaia sp. HN010]|uniref:hypothetical protein n=1 Tax=Asaia sp. HN010 TaxID=3081233 RepID=UPI003019273F
MSTNAMQIRNTAMIGCVALLRAFTVEAPGELAKTTFAQGCEGWMWEGENRYHQRGYLFTRRDR